MEYIWIIDKGDYGSRTQATEASSLGCESDYKKYRDLSRSYFHSRKDAEDYIRPIVKEAFDIMISDIMANEEDEEEEDKIVGEFLKRGFHEIRRDELKEGDKFHELFSSEDPSTIFTCPVEHEYDHIGCIFAEVKRVRIY